MSARISGIGMTSQRTRMRMIERLREQGIADEAVLNVMNEVPRHIFVEDALASRAYEDFALPLGFGQTISQPYIVARMTELLTVGQPLGNFLLDSRGRALHVAGNISIDRFQGEPRVQLRVCDAAAA